VTESGQHETRLSYFSPRGERKLSKERKFISNPGGRGGLGTKQNCTEKKKKKKK